MSSVVAESRGRTSRYFATLNRTSYPKAHEPQKDIILLEHHFRFIQTLIPENDEHGRVIKFYPQEQYRYKQHRKLHKYGSGAFCRFSVMTDNVSGVYLLVADSALLYIGQTCNLNQRFNNKSYGSYSFITPAACYEGGQSTNCKINQLVLRQFEIGQPVLLYFLPTHEHKRIEKELLQHFSTPHNH